MMESYLKKIDDMTQQWRQKMHLCEGGMFLKSRDRPLKNNNFDEILLKATILTKKMVKNDF